MIVIVNEDGYFRGLAPDGAPDMSRRIEDALLFRSLIDAQDYLAFTGLGRREGLVIQFLPSALLVRH